MKETFEIKGKAFFIVFKGLSVAKNVSDLRVHL